MRYPKRQLDTAALVGHMIAGITEHEDIFVHCDAEVLQEARSQFAQATEALAAAQSQAAIAAAAKLKKFKEMRAEMKRQIKLGVVDTSNSPAELSYIGWGSKREPQQIDIPAAPMNLKITAQSAGGRLTPGDGMICLEWGKGKSGGPLNCYIVERRQFNGEGWSDWLSAATALNNEYRLTKQPTGCKLEYRVRAVNKSGSTLPSNSIAVVL